MRSGDSTVRGAADLARRALGRAVLAATAVVMLEPGLSRLVGLR